MTADLLWTTGIWVSARLNFRLSARLSVTARTRASSIMRFNAWVRAGLGQGQGKQAQTCFEEMEGGQELG